MEAVMQNEIDRRAERMMNAVAGLGGRSALSSEIDLRLGLPPSSAGVPGWLATFAVGLCRIGRTWKINSLVRFGKIKSGIKQLSKPQGRAFRISKGQ
jgi:hypothetical protein